MGVKWGLLWVLDRAIIGVYLGDKWVLNRVIMGIIMGFSWVFSGDYYGCQVVIIICII